MRLVTKIFNRVANWLNINKKSQIEKLTTDLIKELEAHYKKTIDVNCLRVWFDYSHESRRTLYIEFNDFRLDIETKEINKNYKP